MKENILENKLYPVEQVVDFIKQGYLMSLAGDERLLAQLPKGNWVAGTIPYFMDKEKNIFTQDLINVNFLGKDAEDFIIKTYDADNIETFPGDGFDNGFTFLIIPSLTEVHKSFAIKAQDMENLYNNPVVGWVSGVDLNSLDIPKVFDGTKASAYDNKAVAIHVKLPENMFAQLEIVNIFEQDSESPEIMFFTDNFDVINCLIDGEEKNFAKYIKENHIDTKLPLVADYTGASINVSIKEVDVEHGIVSFYAPVFSGKIYKFAKPIRNYERAFGEKLQEYAEINSQFACNCILNYLYGELEGKKTGNLSGPITFGEVAYQLLNQTFVIMTIEKL